jgi:type IV secretory pathway VirB10-like protein
VAANSINLQGRKPEVVSPMSNGILWLGGVLVVVLVAAILYGFHTRFQKKAARAKASAIATVATDAATSNRAQVTTSAQAQRLIPLSSMAGNSAVTVAPGVLGSAGAALGNAVQTDAHPFPTSQPGPSPVAQYYYVPPAPSSYSAAAAAEQTPAERAEQRAAERREAAIVAPTGITANSNSQTTAAKPIDAIDSDLQRISQLSSAANGIVRPGGTAFAGAGFPGGGAGMGERGDDPNRQDDKRKFQQSSGDEEDYLKTTRVLPVSPWVVERGDKITAVLPARIVSDLPGDLVAEVHQDVYDSPTHKFVLIPAGSLLAGQYNSSVSYGQGRVQVVWTYLRFPDGSFINLDKFVSHAADGATGLKDQTDNHLKRLVGGVLLSSVFAAGIQISQNHSGTNSTLAYPSTSQIASSAIGQQAGRVGEELTSRNLNVQPTLKIRPGEIFYVSVQKSMVLPGPYQAISLGKNQ